MLCACRVTARRRRYRLDRNDHGEHRSSSNSLGAGADADAAAMIVDDLLADPQAETGPYSTLGREERLEQVGESIPVDAFAVIGDGHSNLETAIA